MPSNQGVFGLSTANMAVTTPSCKLGRSVGETFDTAVMATQQAQQKRQHETGGPLRPEELKGKVATNVGMHMSNSPSLESEVGFIRKSWGGLKHELIASITTLKKEKAEHARKLRFMESISQEKAAREKELAEQTYGDTKIKDRDDRLSAAEELRGAQQASRNEGPKRAKTMCQIPEADARPSRPAVSAEMESLKAELQRTLAALKESEASRSTMEKLLEETRQAPLAFGGRLSRSTPAVSSASDATYGSTSSAESEATLSSITAGRASTFDRTPGAVGGTRPQVVNGKPVVGGVFGLPSLAVSMATPVQQHQWNGHHNPETAMLLPSTSGGPRDTSSIPEARLASVRSAQAQEESTQPVRSQSSIHPTPARERFGNSAINAVEKSASVAQEGGMTTGTTISGAGETQLGKRGRRFDAAEEDVTRRIDLQEGGHTVILFDLETTGLCPFESRVLQLAAKVMGTQDLNHSFSAYVKPGAAPVPVEIQELTGITAQALAANNAQPFRETWARFASWLTTVAPKGTGGGLVMVAHKASFDHGFVVSELVRAGLDRFTMGKLGIVAFVDSLAVLRDRRMWRQHLTDVGVPKRPTKFTLVEIFEYLYGHKMPGAHNALGDVEGLESILSAPGIAERWRVVASTHPTCQITESRSRIEHDAAQKRVPKD